MTETAHLQWIYSMHKCAGVHDAMTTTTSLKHNTSDQGPDQHEPFDINEPRLHKVKM